MSTQAATDVLAERARQQAVEGWDAAHDDEHDNGQMAKAAAAYAYATFSPWYSKRHMWPWGPKWWKPRSHRENLVRAGALILAEIERLDRLAPERPADVRAEDGSGGPGQTQKGNET